MYCPYPPSSNTYSPPSNTYTLIYIFYNPVAIWPQPLCNHGQIVAKDVKDVRDEVGMKNGMEGGEKNLDVNNCVCCCLLLLFIINIK